MKEAKEPAYPVETWISLTEYEKIALDKLKDKPVIKMLLSQNIPFEKWGSNVHRLVDEAMCAKRETRVMIAELSKPQQP